MPPVQTQPPHRRLAHEIEVAQTLVFRAVRHLSVSDEPVPDAFTDRRDRPWHNHAVKRSDQASECCGLPCSSEQVFVPRHSRIPGAGGLELQTERELGDSNVTDLSRRADGGGDLPKGRCAVDDVRHAGACWTRWIGKVRVVEKIERIGPEGQVDLPRRNDWEDFG